MKAHLWPILGWIVLALCPPIVPVYGLSVSQSTLGNIFLTGETVKFTLSGSGTRVEWSVKNYFGQTVTGGTLAMSGSAVLQTAIAQPGYYELSLIEKNASGTIGSFNTTFSITTPVALSPASPFGAQTHCAQYNAPELMSVLARGNISHIRDEQYWNEIQSGSSFIFSSKLTGYMNAAAARGITPLITLDWSHPAYDYGAGQFTAPHTDNGRLGYANYANAVLTRYGSQIPAVEIWNEYNGGTFVQGPATSNKGYYYAQMLKKTYDVTRPNFPSVKMVAGAAVPIGHGFFRDMFQNGALPYIDVLSIHPYRNDPQGVELEINELRELTKSYNGGFSKPIWATEFSMNATSEADRKKAAPYLVQIATMLRNAGVERIYYYLSQEDNLFPYRGLVRDSVDPAGKYVPNPAFSAYANLIGQLTGWTPAGRITTGLKTTTYVYKFTLGNQTRYVVWAYSPTTLAISPSGSVTKTDLMGVTTNQSPTNGEIQIGLTNDPVYLTGSISAFSDPGNTVVADMVSDFDKVQGSKNWSYGFATLAPNAAYQVASFKYMNWEIGQNDSFRWRKPAWDYPYISSDTLHPGYTEWVVRRWQSTVAGKIRLEGSAQVGAYSSDGVGLRIFLDGREILNRIVSPGATLPFSVSDLPVEFGSKLDITINGLSSINNDATIVNARIFEMPAPATPTPTPATPTPTPATPTPTPATPTPTPATPTPTPATPTPTPATPTPTPATPTPTPATPTPTPATPTPTPATPTPTPATPTPTPATPTPTPATPTPTPATPTPTPATPTPTPATPTPTPATPTPTPATPTPTPATPTPTPATPTPTPATPTPTPATPTPTPATPTPTPATPTPTPATPTPTPATPTPTPATPTPTPASTGDLVAPKLSAQAINNNRIRLNWTDNSIGEEGFYIEWKFGEFAYLSVANVPPNTTTFLHAENMAQGRVFTYRIRAFAGSRVSPWSNTVSLNDTPL